MVYRITVEDSVVYEVPVEDYQTEQMAVNQAWDWFNERKPKISVEVINERKISRWAVVNPDGTFAGIPCESEEEARELACQEEGRRIFEMSYNSDSQILWGD